MDYLYFFVLGSVIGSFLNVIIYRIPAGESIVLPPSHCPKCNRRLKPMDLIPILSWIGLKGKCRYCHESVAARYTLIELLTGVLFTLSYHQIGMEATLIAYLLLISLLIAHSFIDLDHYILPDELNIFGVIAFVLTNLLFSFIPWGEALLGGAAGLIPLLLMVILTRGNGMGLGDVKLMAVIGLYIGWKLALLTLLLSFVLGGVFGVILLATKIKSRKDPIPFGPWISIAAFIAMHWGNGILRWYLS